MSSLPFAGACYVALLCALAIAILHRFYDPFPWRSRIVLAGLLLLHLGPNLVAGRSPLPLRLLDGWEPWASTTPGRTPGKGGLFHGDLMLEGYPWFVEARRQWRAGELPRWNPRAGAGQPLLADPQAEVLHPYTLLTLPLADHETAQTVRTAMRIAVAFLFTLLYLQRNGLGEAAAALGASGVAGAGFVATWLAWPLATSASLLPAVLYAVVRVDERGGSRDRLLLMAAVAALLVGGHPEGMGYVLGAAVVVAGGRLLRRPGGERWAAGRRLLGALLLGCGLAGVTLLPATDYLLASTRFAVIEGRRTLAARDGTQYAEELTADGRARWGARVASRAAVLVAPNALGNGPGARSRGSDNWIELNGAFVGTAVLALAVAAVSRRPVFADERAWRVLAALALLGMVLPAGIADVLGRLPPLASGAIHEFGRANLLVAFAVAACAAGELDRWSRGDARRRRLLAAAALTTAFVLAAAFVDPIHPATSRERSLALASSARQLAALAVALGLLAAGRSHRTRAAWSLVVLAALEGAWFFGRHHAAYARRPDLLDPPRIAALRAGTAAGFRLAARGDLLPPNLATTLGLADIRVAGPGQPRRYADALRPLFPKELEATRLATAEHPLLDLLGVRLQLTPDAETGWRLRRRPSALPTLFLPAAAQRVPLAQAAVAVHRVADFAQLAIVSDRSGTGDAALAERWEGGARVRVVDRKPSRLLAEATVATPRLLASNVYQDGGWTVRIDDEMVPAVLTNAAFVGAWLPAGRHRVELRYAPASLRLGASISLGCAIAALAWTFWARGRAYPSEAR